MPRTGEKDYTLNYRDGAEVAKLLADFTNGCDGKDIKEFVEEMCNRTHRTLQQKFGHLVWEFLKEMSTTEWGDLRNEDLRAFAKRAMSGEELPYPPFRLI